MTAEPSIGWLGTGKMGSGFARLLAAKGINIAIGHRDPAKAEALARKIGSRAQSGSNEEGVKRAEMVILAVPYRTVEEALRSVGDWTGKIIIDISNPITPDYKALTVGHTSSAAEEIQKLAPRAKVFGCEVATSTPLTAAFAADVM